jgi:hypothetical protein
MYSEWAATGPSSTELGARISAPANAPSFFRVTCGPFDHSLAGFDG